MKRKTENKIVLVTRPTGLDDLVKRFNTVDQARFYVEHLGADFADYLAEHEVYQQAKRLTETTLESWGRLQVVDRSFLPNFLFGPEDTIVVLGQDGLVANTLKYLSGQPVVGVNPDRKRWDGRLLPFDVHDLLPLMGDVFRKSRPLHEVTLAEARLNNGQVLRAVNDLFIGPKSHGSARYRISIDNLSERQSSSGIIISTGLGSTGWFSSLMAGANGVAEAAAKVFGLDAKSPSDLKPQGYGFPWNARQLYFTVREPYPSRNTGTSIVFGEVTSKSPLRLLSEMPERGVIFSDGMEHDFLDFNSGTQATITLSDERGMLVG